MNIITIIAIALGLGISLIISTTVSIVYATDANTLTDKFNKMFPNAKPGINENLGKCMSMKLKQDRTQCLANTFNITTNRSN